MEYDQGLLEIRYRANAHLVYALLPQLFLPARKTAATFRLHVILHLHLGLCTFAFYILSLAAPLPAHTRAHTREHTRAHTREHTRRGLVVEADLRPIYRPMSRELRATYVCTHVHT